MIPPTDTPVMDPAIDAGAEGFMTSIEDAFAGLDAVDDGAADIVVPDIEPKQNTTNVVDEADPLDDITNDTDVADWTPEAARAFKEVRNDLKSERAASQALRETLEQRESRITELEALSSDTELDTMRQKIDEYESKLLVTKLEDTQAYKQLVEDPLRSVLAASDAIATKYGVDVNELFDALALTDEVEQEEKISELLASASERDRFKAYQLIEALKPIQAQQEALRENSGEALREAQELEAIHQQEQVRVRSEARKSAAKQVAARLTEKLTFLPNIEGVDMESIVREVSGTDLTTMSPVNSAYNQMAATLFPKVAREYVKMMRENESLVSKLAAYANSAPRVGNRNGGGMSQAGAAVSFVDAVRSAFGE